MGRRAIMGDFGQAIPQSEHGYQDSELMTGGQYAKHRGVTRQRVYSNFNQGLIDRYLNSKNKVAYHAETCDFQWQQQSDPKTVSVPTTGQRSRGMTGEDAMNKAGDFSPTPAADPGGGVGKAGTEKKPAAPADKNTTLFSQARTKGMTHKAQLSEVQFHKAVGHLVDREGIIQAMQEMGNMTRDRVLGVTDFIIDELFGIAENKEIPYEHRKVEGKLKLRAELEKALTMISDTGIDGALSELPD